MKRVTVLVAAALGVVLAAPVFAGGSEKCTQDAQACLNGFSNYKAKGWLGLEYDKSAAEKTHLIKRAVAGSPAEAAGFQAGDVLVSLNGVPLTAEKEALKAAKGDWSVGQSVSYVVSRKSKEVKLSAKLAAMPEEVFARMVGDHMVRDHMTAATAAAVK
jgi:predicted metalloprotease with PDZ domain